MRHALRLLALLPALWLGACGGGGGEPRDSQLAGAQLGEEFVLGYGETADVGPLSLEFTEVVEDYRCPRGTDVACVLIGNARILVTVTHAQGAQVLTLNTDPDYGTSAIFSGHIIELRRLDPWPSTPRPPTDFTGYTALLFVDGWVAPAGG